MKLMSVFIRLVSSLSSIIASLSHRVRNMDVQSAWHCLLAWSGTEVEMAEEKRKSLILINCLLSLLQLLNLLRHGSTLYFNPHSLDYLFGHTSHAAAFLTKPLVVICCAALLYSLVHRLIIGRTQYKREARVRWTVQKIVKLGPHAAREEKIRATRRLTIATIVCWIGNLSCALPLFTTTFALNVTNSESKIEIVCWTFWYLNDLLLAVLISSDFFVGVASWYILTWNYEHKLLKMTRRMEQLKEAIEKEPWAVTFHVRDVRRSFGRLTSRAVSVNRSSPQMLSLITFVLTRIGTACAVIIGSDAQTSLVAVLLLIACLFPVACTLWILWKAASVTAIVRRLHNLTAATAARLATDTRSLLPLEQKQLLTWMLESMASEENLLVLRTWTGDKYTRLMLFSSLLVAVANFLLTKRLQTFLANK